MLLHARSWRPIIFSALLLASKVWHDISYWNSDFSTICPMFTIRNVNKLERTILELLSYDTIISSSQVRRRTGVRTCAYGQFVQPSGRNPPLEPSPHVHKRT